MSAAPPTAPPSPPSPPPPAVFTNNPGETSMRVWWTPSPLPPPPATAVVGLLLEVREFPRPWEEARRIDVEAGAAEVAVGQLVPTATFEFRLRYRLEGGGLSSPGPVGVGDTLVAGCTPKGGEEGGRKGKGKEKACATQ